MIALIKKWLPYGLVLLALILIFTFDTFQSRIPEQEEEKEKMKPGEAVVHVLLKTNFGEIVLALDREKAPITVDNFLAYVEEGFFNGTIFHRVIPDFMIQGAGFTVESRPIL